MWFKDDINPTLERLFQRRTYYGLIEGVPTIEINEDKLKYIPSEARRHFGFERLHLIVPTQKIQKGNWRDSAFLPNITCMAELSYPEPIKDDRYECSRLILVWYQDEYAMPIAPEVLDKIAELEWKLLSEDAYL